MPSLAKVTATLFSGSNHSPDFGWATNVPHLIPCAISFQDPPPSGLSLTRKDRKTGNSLKPPSRTCVRHIKSYAHSCAPSDPDRIAARSTNGCHPLLRSSASAAWECSFQGLRAEDSTFVGDLLPGCWRVFGQGKLTGGRRNRIDIAAPYSIHMPPIRGPRAKAGK
ncbi:uncharacterized protein ATNIH1004_002053 [Aspergillus tanneri]|uniref:Uncharacterized protein n=1 Tax=Aspergillus tanneri TaxID=1220188 RepID=A0A5M9M8R2_9EURO|nr:uncharacterized protein ATNIH1004_002053 [Aspergillus tanneri]KAA8641313.1 hypothetical protein ATNIH1004_002053 [Aspergillus tanneri]